MSKPNVRRVAVIGAGPSGISAVHGLVREKKFDTIRVFERRGRIGGTWIYDAKPDDFPTTSAKNPSPRQIPSTIPGFAPPAAEDTTRRTGIYSTLDSNVGSEVMEFTHTPFPKINSALTTERYGHNNPTRPYAVVAGYLDDLIAPYLNLVTLNTTLEKLEKDGEVWVLTLRQTGRESRGEKVDYWWTERFDAVIVATGHYTVPFVPAIPGLKEFQEKLPGRLEHSKQFRDINEYVGKRVVVVGGNVSAGDLVIDLHRIVSGQLVLSQRGRNEKLDSIWNLRNVRTTSTIKSLSTENNGTVEFTDGFKTSNIDKIIFATGYRLSYPFIQPDPVSESGRLQGFYKHIFKIGDPTLAVVGQVRAALTFRCYEYQAIAVARVLAGRGTLPSILEQKGWEAERLEYKGPTALFHEIAPDFKEYFEGLRAIAGFPAEGSDGYELPPYKDEWVDYGLVILALKDKYVRSLKTASEEIVVKSRL
ncbi:putative dimethylaniline monooxygenase [Leptodontidium sp. 2 PMI_412]|nr:putative dimethylaniline monooxygenase [Leptodontidium sp. 2 PMI_412]